MLLVVTTVLPMSFPTSAVGPLIYAEAGDTIEVRRLPSSLTLHHTCYGHRKHVCWPHCCWVLAWSMPLGVVSFTNVNQQGFVHLCYILQRRYPSHPCAPPVGPLQEQHELPSQPAASGRHPVVKCSQRHAARGSWRNCPPDMDGTCRRCHTVYVLHSWRPGKPLLRKKKHRIDDHINTV
jgi:hypothetical protein